MKKTWRCFFCDVVLRSEKAAKEHFGANELATPACQIKGHEHGLVAIIREQEAELSRYRAEDSDMLRILEQLKSEHADDVRRAEELGFDRGVQNMKAHGLRVP